MESLFFIYMLFIYLKEMEVLKKNLDVILHYKCMFI